MESLARHRRIIVPIAVVTLELLSFTATAGSPASHVSFNRQVRPILAKHCVTCHGPDEEAREAGLRLDIQEGSREDRGGYRAIEPGDPDDSELIFRVRSDDDDLRMPPAGDHPPLAEAEIETLERWIRQGGNYERHWAFVPPKRHQPPQVRQPAWCSQPLDRFILQSMERAGLKPSKPSEPTDWLRRVFLDLTGTLPSPRQTQRFLDDAHPLARRRVVDRLLASPDFAARFTRPWLDLARYADTNGYEKDRPRTIWPYRDWVLDAINADMPFDQFSIEQLAGDMLPNATEAQRVATGFHRNTMLNEEGGIDPLEFRWLAVVDRVATTGTVWLGLTTGCAQCHTHKYDPITHTDYFRWFALLNSADEPDLILDSDNGEAESAYRRAGAEVDRELAEVRDDDSDIAKRFRQLIDEAKRAASTPWIRLEPTAVESSSPRLTVLDDNSILASGDVRKRDTYRIRFQVPATPKPVTALRLSVLPHESLPASGPGLAYYEGRRGDFFLSELRASVDGRSLDLIDPSISAGKISVGSGQADAGNPLDGDGSTGWSTSGNEGQRNEWVVRLEQPITGPAELDVELLFERHFAAALGHFAVSATTQSGEVRATVWPDGGEESSEAIRRLVMSHPDLKSLRKPIESLQELRPEPTRTLVMRQREREDLRETFRHHRGEYLQPNEKVAPGNLSMLESLQPEYRNDRLGLARFLVSEDNPLVARVQVNRIWRHFFGTGIVDTAGDFGTQSEPPSHPELIDHLAVDWMDGGWSRKRLIRKLVLSSTYAQRIEAPPDSDPGNRLLSVFPYRRLDAETIRDSMLSAAGVLVRHWGGPSVYPPQPASVSRMAYGKPEWPTSTGGDRYRRSLYTFARRTAPFAAYATFDAPTGELCLPRRDRSTTPLQALTLLNDELYLEIAEHLATDVLHRRGDAEPAEIVDAIFRRVLVRAPSDDERQDVLTFYRETGDWTLVARVILNTDEAITVP